MGENVWNGNDDIESNGRRFQETLFEVAATMRSLVKAQEEQHQLNASMLQSLIDLQRKIYSRREGSKSSTRRRRRNSSGDTSSSPHKRRRIKHHRDRSLDEFLHLMVR